ncbi:MAG: penicillin-binding protein 1C, partial [Bacteroidales bacterium]|nr:penicillin-binding protein 1C [Bacteroidales bacterium]
LGITTMNKPADHYGLTLILGGAEASLWELSGIYASLARVLKNYENNSSQYFKEDMHMPYFTLDKRPKSLGYSPINASSIYLTFNAMKEVNRPTQEQGWQSFGHVENIAWKTGTSFGNRDAWSIGVSTDYVVGVWVGNADGEGRPDLTGVGSAAPIMFDVFKLFNTNSWFNQPYDDMKLIDVCEKSGYKASNICDETVKEWVQEYGVESKPCPYHKLVHLSKDGLYRVNSSCENTYDIKNVSWFVLPAVMEWYYKIIHADYKTIPPYRKDCKTLNVKNIDIIYPENLTQIFLPKGFDGTLEKVVFKVVHRKSNSTIFWHIDNEYVGKTMSFHELALQPLPGKHKLTLVDENGESLERWFTIVEK